MNNHNVEIFDRNNKEGKKNNLLSPLSLMSKKNDKNLNIIVLMKKKIKKITFH